MSLRGSEFPFMNNSPTSSVRSFGGEQLRRVSKNPEAELRPFGYTPKRASIIHFVSSAPALIEIRPACLSSRSTEGANGL